MPIFRPFRTDFNRRVLVPGQVTVRDFLHHFEATSGKLPIRRNSEHDFIGFLSGYGALNKTTTLLARSPGAGTDLLRRKYLQQEVAWVSREGTEVVLHTDSLPDSFKEFAGAWITTQSLFNSRPTAAEEQLRGIQTFHRTDGVREGYPICHFEITNGNELHFEADILMPVALTFKVGDNGQASILTNETNQRLRSPSLA